VARTVSDPCPNSPNEAAFLPTSTEARGWRGECNDAQILFAGAGGLALALTVSASAEAAGGGVGGGGMGGGRGMSLGGGALAMQALAAAGGGLGHGGLGTGTGSFGHAGLGAGIGGVGTGGGAVSYGLGGGHGPNGPSLTNGIGTPGGDDLHLGLSSHELGLGSNFGLDAPDNVLSRAAPRGQPANHLRHRQASR